jgi:hypothetical protein|tara:strand:+ start:155 stop:331 length:177 start_codon:yes stop_codon:yes gene_type:complete
MRKIYIDKETIYRRALEHILEDMNEWYVKERADFFVDCWKTMIDYALNQDEYEIEVKR